MASGRTEAAICVQDVDVQCVLQFTLIHAAGCALHRHTSRVIHRLELYFFPCRGKEKFRPQYVQATDERATPNFTDLEVRFIIHTNSIERKRVKNPVGAIVWEGDVPLWRAVPPPFAGQRSQTKQADGGNVPESGRGLPGVCQMRSDASHDSLNLAEDGRHRSALGSSLPGHSESCFPEIRYPRPGRLGLFASKRSVGHHRTRPIETSPPRDR